VSGRYRIGIDVGGTFTDLFLLDRTSGAMLRHKLLSTPGEPHLAPLQGLREILALAQGRGEDVEFVGLGTTVMTNALLERKGAPTGLVTTAGFRDLLEIARQQRPHTFDPFVSKAPPLVPRRLRLEVNERTAADGSQLVAMQPDDVRTAVETLRSAGVESIAICFLHAYANPAHEQEAAAIVRAAWPQAHVSVSSEVLPEFREFERLSSTVVNAYLMPIARTYLAAFESEVGRLGVPAAPFVMSSGGGIMTPARAGDRPIDTLFSGPSGGVSAAIEVGARAGKRNLIAFDMGGTSTDVCLVQDGRAQVSHARVINGCPIKAAALDVHTVGAGGSSIATLDAGGMLQVGPQSAGARPGPACYGRGGAAATVTDANVVLGRLNPEYLLGGALRIDAARAFAVIEAQVAKPRRMGVVEAAAAMVAIADANMAHAVRFVSVERGLDPADFVLVAFGGAGPVHAASVAQMLGVTEVLIPVSPGVMCAMGVLVNDLQSEASRTRIVAETHADCIALVDRIYRELEAQAVTAFGAPAAGAAPVLERAADVRYLGQNHELTVGVAPGAFEAASLAQVKQAFNRAHRELYGYDSPDKLLELVTLRVRARLPVGRVDLGAERLALRSGPPVPSAERKVYFDAASGYVDCAVHARALLRPGDRLQGPLIIEQMDCTTVVPPGCTLEVDGFANLRIAVGRG
jgi:N-methylhydantoinase A